MRLKLNTIELSAILSHAEGGELCWMDGYNCPGAVVAWVGPEVDGRGTYCDSQRALEVSYASNPGKVYGGLNVVPRSAEEALDWMRDAGLV